MNEDDKKKFLPTTNVEQHEADFAETRSNLQELIEVAKAGLREYSEVAAQSQNARAYEVLFNGIKITAEINEKLADHAVKRRKEEHPETEKPITNNNYLQITTAELSKMLSDKKKDD